MSLRDYCLSMLGSYEEFPFGPEAAVFKVKNKMFALIPIDIEPPSISLKCDPKEAIILRETYESVQAGYHLNKTHWNTVTINGEIDNQRLKEMIEDSYILVRQKLKKSEQTELEALETK